MKFDEFGCLIGDINDYVRLVVGDGIFIIVFFGINLGIISVLMVGYVVKVSGDFNGDGLLDLYVVKVDDYGCLIGDINDVIW